MRFSRQEYWNELSCPPPGDLPDLGIKIVSLTSLALAGGFFTTSTTWKSSLKKTLWQKSHEHPHLTEEETRFQKVWLVCPDGTEMDSNGEAEGGSWRSPQIWTPSPLPQTQKEQGTQVGLSSRGGWLFPRDLGCFPGGLEGISKVTTETGVTAVKNTHPFSVTLTSKRLAGLVFSQKGSQTPASTTAKPGGQLGVNMVWLLPWGKLFQVSHCPGMSSKPRQDPWGPCDVALLASSTWYLRASCSVLSHLSYSRWWLGFPFSSCWCFFLCHTNFFAWPNPSGSSRLSLNTTSSGKPCCSSWDRSPLFSVSSALGLVTSLTTSHWHLPSIWPIPSPSF